MRNFLYCSDVAESFDIILHKGTPGEIYNIGSNDGISVIDLAKYLIQKVSKDSWNGRNVGDCITVVVLG